MSKAINIDAIVKAATITELLKHTDLDHVKTALRAHETSRLAHIKYNARRNALIKRAIEAGLDKDI